MTQSTWTLPHSGWLQVDAAHLEYAIYGPPPSQAPTIVLLHEGLGSVSHWKDFPTNLAKETSCGVFVYSRSGYGQSSPAVLPRPLNYMSLEAVNVLPKILNTIEFRSGFLLGHSDGASISAIHAGELKDERVKGVILIAPHFFAEPRGLESILDIKLSYEAGKFGEKFNRYHKNPDNAFSGWANAWLDPKFKNWDISNCLDNIRVPVLAIQGRDDEYGSLDQIEEIKSRLNSLVRIEILDECGHSPHKKYPKLVLNLISKFVTAVTAF